MRALIAQNDMICAGLTAQRCRSIGCEVVIVNDGAKALELALAEEWDIVFLDNRLPGMSGLEITRRIADKRHVIMMSSDPIHEQAIAAGARGFLRNECGPETLEATLVDIVHRDKTDAS